MSKHAPFLLHPSSGRKVYYSAIRTALEKSGGGPYKMSLTDHDEMRAVVDCVNAGIDSHLEACFFEGKDKYETLPRRIGDDGPILCWALECDICAESLPVLLRRLSEVEFTESNAAESLCSDILGTLGFDEYGKFVGVPEENSV